MDSLRPAEVGDGLVPIVRRLALAFAASVTIALPSGYFGLRQSSLIDHIETLAEARAGAVNNLVTANPDMWMFQTQRLEDALLRYPASRDGERAAVRDAAGNSVASVGALPEAPVLIRSSALHDSGRVLGRVEITHSYRPVVYGTLVAALAGLLLGALVYAVVLILPLRALRRVTAALAEETTERNSLASRYRALAESANDAIITADGAGSIAGWNPAAARLFGYTEAEAIGQPLTLVVPHRYRDRHGEGIRRIQAGGERRLIGKSVELHGLTKAGREFPLELGLSEWETPEGRFFAAIIHDISARRRAEEALRAAEQQFRGLVEQSIAGIYVVQDGRYAYVNPRFAEIRGYGSADVLIGRDFLSTVAEKDRGRVAENIRRLLAGEARTSSYSFAALRADGSTVEVGVHGAFAVYHGRPAIIGLMQDISEKKRAEEEIARYVEQLKTAFMSTVEVATTMGELRDPYTAGHQRRVAELAVAIGAELGLDADRCEGLRVAGHLHDMGKITLPSEILSKPGKLSAVEFQLIQGHAQAGYEILKGVKSPWPVAEVALQHHERLDGSGYPQGLKGEAILLEARIIAVADVVEAMASHRPYRPGIGIDKALAEIEQGRGRTYDPAAVDACLTLFRKKGFAFTT